MTNEIEAPATFKPAAHIATTDEVREISAQDPLQAILTGHFNDYNVPDLVSLALKFQGKDPIIYSAVCPSYGYWEGDVSYAGTMYKEWQAMMKRVDAGLDPNDESAAIPEPQASSTKPGAASNSASPRNYEEYLAQASPMTTEDVAAAE